MDRDRARDLRKHSTDAERILWSKLRNRRFGGFKFRRQVILGNYCVDFVCFEMRLVIELDGSQHAEPNHIQHDAERTGWLESQGSEGFRILRF
jgi:very-short-patch-repair endonuclease